MLSFKHYAFPKRGLFLQSFLPWGIIYHRCKNISANLVYLFAPLVIQIRQNVYLSKGNKTVVFELFFQVEDRRYKMIPWAGLNFGQLLSYQKGVTEGIQSVRETTPPPFDSAHFRKAHVIYRKKRINFSPLQKSSEKTNHQKYISKSKW